jgi:D-alanyl-D-alanine dipeptidase
MSQRPTDIVSPVTNQILPPKASVQEARTQGRVAYDSLTPANAVFIRHQIDLMAEVRDFSSLAEHKSNVRSYT